MARKTAKVRAVTSEMDRLLEDMPEVDKESVLMARGIAVSFGRALTLSFAVGMIDPARAELLDQALEKQNAAWRALADDVMLFALDKD